MEELKHFSHGHPLVLKDIQKDEGHKVICKMCGKQIFDPAYSCSQCDYFLHKRCAELRRTVKDSAHRGLLNLQPAYKNLSCDFCELVWNGFGYKCLCDFNICIPCYIVDRTITHKSHEHQLSLLLRPTSCFCSICGMKDTDSSYLCGICQFWVHKSCTLLPNTINRTYHHHSLILMPMFELTEREDQDCYICGELINLSYWAYCCALCRCYIHVKCSTPSSTPLMGPQSDLDHKNHDPGVLHLPTKCLVEHLSLEKIQSEPKIQHWSHEHPLILVNMQNNEEMSSNTTLCDSCVQPISHPFYCCVQCDYFLHVNCVNLPREIQHPIDYHPIRLSKSSDQFYLHTRCEACNSFINGFFYKCDSCKLSIDVKCALLPTSIVHQAHKHTLRQSARRLYHFDRCNACGHGDWGAFKCDSCKFQLCYGCVLLPPTVEHGWDRHPLVLTYPPFFDHPDEFHCDFCEIEINTRYWIYHCQKCDQSFDSKCIHHSYRNVKFGGTSKFEDHPHPLKFLRNAMKQVTCSRCNELSGDDPVFECQGCCYMICKKCVEKNVK